MLRRKSGCSILLALILMGLLALDNIDINNTITNDIQEIYRVFGIEAARQAIYNELTEVIEFDSTYINYHHLMSFVRQNDM